MTMKRLLVLCLVLASLPLAVPPAGAEHCGTPPENRHTYGPGSVGLPIPGGGRLNSVLGIIPPSMRLASGGTDQTGTISVGGISVGDNNTFDCDGNGLPDDFDGDYEFGEGGGFFGIAGNELVNIDCDLDLHLHPATTIEVFDIVGTTLPFSAGYEGWDPVNEVYCEKDGIIGDDPEDCIEPFPNGALPDDPVPVDPCNALHTDTHAGVNLDAGVWVFVDCYAYPPSVECAVSGTIAVV